MNTLAGLFAKSQGGTASGWRGCRLAQEPGDDNEGARLESLIRVVYSLTIYGRC
jgi:hypothetical protein